MANILIIYGSTTGNTEFVAEKISEKLEDAGHDVDMENAMDVIVDNEDITKYDTYVWGSSTWNDGELQDDFVELHMQMTDNPPNLSGKNFACFGCGESVYEKFCTAVDILEESLEDWGAEKLQDGLKIDGYPEEDENVEKTEKWINNLIGKL
jgi:flavodoxin short chain